MLGVLWVENEESVCGLMGLQYKLLTQKPWKKGEDPSVPNRKLPPSTVATPVWWCPPNYAQPEKTGCGGVALPHILLSKVQRASSPKLPLQEDRHPQQ